MMIQGNKNTGRTENQEKKKRMRVKRKKKHLHRLAMMPTLLKGVSRREPVTAVENQDISHQIALMQPALQRVNGTSRQLPTTCVQKHMRVLKEIKDHRGEKMMIIYRL